MIPHCLLHILYGHSKTLLLCMHHIFSHHLPLSLHNQSVSPNPVYPNDRSPSPRIQDSIHLPHPLDSVNETTYWALWRWPRHIQCETSWAISLPMSSTLHGIFWSSPEWQKVTYDLWSQMGLGSKARSVTNKKCKMGHIAYPLCLSVIIGELEIMSPLQDYLGGIKWDFPRLSPFLYALFCHSTHHVSTSRKGHYGFSLALDNIFIFIRWTQNDFIFW